MRKKFIIRAISDCTDPRDHKAGLGDICLALGKGTEQKEVERMAEMLRKNYSAYATVDSSGGCLTVKPLAHAESARYERRLAQFVQWGLATVTATGATLLGFFLGKYFGQ